MAPKNWIRRLSLVVLICLLLQSMTPIADVWARENATTGWKATNELSQEAQSVLGKPAQIAGPGYDPSPAPAPPTSNSSLPVLGKPLCHDPGDTSSTSDQEDTCKDGKKGGSQITYDTRALNLQETIRATGLPLIASYDSQYEAKPLPLFAHIPTGQAINNWQIRIQGWTFQGTGARALAFWDTTDKNTGRLVTPGVYYFENTYSNKLGTGSTTHPVVVKRAEDGPLGYNWAHNFQAELVKFDEQHVILKALGKWSIFTFNRSQRRYEAGSKAAGYITQQSDGSWIWDRTGADGSDINGLVKFDARGRSTGYEDRVGNQVRIEYDSQGRLARVTDQGGWFIQLAYDGAHITQVTDTSGQNWALQYRNGDLIQIVNPAGHKWRFAYDNDHRIVERTDPKGNATKYAYDGEGRVNTVTDATGAVMAFETRYFSEPLLDEDPAKLSPTMGATTVIYRTSDNKETSREVYIFNERGDIVRKEISPDGGKTQYVWIYKWGTGEDAGKLLATTDPKGRVTTYMYQSNTNLVSSIDRQKARQSTLDYRRPTATANTGLLLISVSQRGLERYLFDYDQQGILQRVRQGELEYRLQRAKSEPGIKGLPEALIWNWNGRGDPAASPDARIIRYEYNPQGRPTTVTDPLGRKILLAYDKAGRLIKTTDGAGRVTSFEYNVLGLMVKQVNAAGAETKYSYDENGNLVEITDAKGNKITYGYDQKDRLIWKRDSLGRTVRLGYDNQGNLVWREDARGARVNLTYDGLKRLVKIVYPTGETWEYAYDATGMLTKATGPSVAWEYEYNDDDLVTKATMKQGNRTTSLTYKYDPGKRVSEVATSDGYQITYNWGVYGQLERVRSPLGVIDYQYKFDNQIVPLLTMVRSDRLVANYSYDAAGRISEIAYRHQQWAANRTITNRYTYDQADNLISIQDAAGTTKYEYDATNQLTSVTYPDGKSIAYTYDAVGNRTKKIGPQGTIDYTYDAANQMLTAGGTKYSYDANGFRVGAWQGQTGINYHWDYQGQLKGVTQRPVESLPYPLSLAGGTPAAETKAQYAYDTLGNQVGRQAGNQVTSYLVDRDHNLQETGADGKPVTRSVYGSGYDELRTTSQGADGEPLAPLTDSIGTVNGAVDRQGNTRFPARYDPFGAPLEREANSPLPGFQGRPYDPASGLYNFRARHYDADAGRFISPDPNTNPYVPGTLNGYSFGLNNPFRYTDPTGKIIPLIIFGAVMGASYFGARYFFSTDAECRTVGGWAFNIIGGAVIGGVAAAAGAGIGIAVGAAGGGAILAGLASGAVVGGLTNFLDQAVLQNKGPSKLSWKDVIQSAVLGALAGGIAGMVVGGEAGAIANPTTKQLLAKAIEETDQWIVGQLMALIFAGAQAYENL